MGRASRCLRERLHGTEEAFHPRSTADLPPVASRWYGHVLTPGASLADSVELEMEGEIRIGRWRPFRARETLAPTRGFFWRATVGRLPTPIVGSDGLVDGRGWLGWRYLGLVPVVRKRGHDVMRSGAGRAAAESIFCPGALLDRRVSWEDLDDDTTTASWRIAKEDVVLHLRVRGDGTLERVWIDRWAELPDGGFGRRRFQAEVESESRFEGVSIPTRVRAGWGDAATPTIEDEFFRATILRASFDS